MRLPGSQRTSLSHARRDDRYPRSLPQCSQADFGSHECAIDTQVGISEAMTGAVTRPYKPTDPSSPQMSNPIAVFNLVPHPNQAGLLGLYAPFINSPIYLVIDARTESDYGLEIEVPAITDIVPVGGLGLTLWAFRLTPATTPCVSVHPVAGSLAVGGFPLMSPTPFTQNPTTCGEELFAVVETISYDNGFDSATLPYPSTTGCGSFSFNPSLFGQPTTSDTDTPSGSRCGFESSAGRHGRAFPRPPKDPCHHGHFAGGSLNDLQRRRRQGILQ